MKQNSLASSFKTRAFRAGGYSIVATAIVLTIVIVLNLVVGALPEKITKFDLTQTKLHSITPQTKQILSENNRDITIYWILTEGNEDTYVKSLLTLVQEQNSRIKVVRKDTDIYPTFATAYTTETVYPNSLIVECGEKYRYLNYYGDILTQDLADYYTTGTYTQYFNGEGALVSAIKYVTSEKLPKIYGLTGHGESAFSTKFATAVKNQNLELEELSLMKENAVPQDADSLLICNPTKDISTAELTVLREYTAGGGNLMLISDYTLTQKDFPNLLILMEDYGMALQPGLVTEADPNHYYGYGSKFDLLPDLQTHATTDPLINGNYFVLLSGAHGIKVAEQLPSEVSVTQLLTSTSVSYAKQKYTQLTTDAKESGDVDGPFALAALATKNSGQESESNVAWIGSASIVNEEVDAEVAGGNMDLLLNVLGFLCDPEEAEMTIHAKPLSETQYLTITNTSRTILTWLVMIILPAGFIGIGALVWYRRKRQ